MATEMFAETSENFLYSTQQIPEKKSYIKLDAQQEDKNYQC
jgi:hypothetical protein